MGFCRKNIIKNFADLKTMRTFALPKRDAQVAEW
jgi:hypothetical protein